MNPTEWWREDGPTANTEDYARALKTALRSSRERETWLELLKAQFRSAQHTTTSMELMDALRVANLLKKGTPNDDYVIANGAYGRLAKAVAHVLDFSPPRWDGQPKWWTTLSYGRDGSEGDSSPEHFQWIMRPRVVDALQLLAVGRASVS